MMVPSKVELPERLKISRLLLVMVPAIEPEVPLLPICNVAQSQISVPPVKVLVPVSVSVPAVATSRPRILVPS